MVREISNTDDIIDSRDVIARIEELEGVEVADGLSAEEDYALSEGEAAELAALRKLAAEASYYAEDWAHGETLIRDSYFEAYAQELAEDLVEGMREAQWPMTCIDWERAARELQMDYTSVDFDGVTYWVR